MADELAQTQEFDGAAVGDCATDELNGRTALGRLLAVAKSRFSMFSTVGTSLAVFGLQAAHAILLARLLGPAGRGEYGTIVFYAQTLLYIGLMGTHYSIARFAAKPSGDPQQLQRMAFRVGLITGLLSVVVALALCVVGLPVDKQYLMPLCFICTLLLPAEHLRLTAQAVDHGRGTFSRFNWSRLFAAGVFPALLVILFLNGNTSLELIAWLTVLVSVLGYLFYWAISDTKRVWTRPSMRPARAIRAAIPDGILVLANDMYDRLSIFLVLWIVSLEGQGHYLAALPAASLLLVAPNAFELFAFRAAANAEAPITMSKAMRAAGLVLLTQAVALVGLQVVLQPLFLLLLGEDFGAAVPVARVLIFALAFNGCAIVGQGYLRGRQLATVGVATRAVATVVMIVCALSLDSFSPLIRIALATMAGHATNALLIGFAAMRDIQRHATRRSEGSQ